MTRRKILMLLASFCLALMLAVLLVAGCAAPSPTPTPTPSPTPTPTPSPTPTPTPSPTPAEEIYKWRMPILSPRGTVEWDAALYFADSVRKASGGRIDIEAFGSEELVPYDQVWEAVQNKVIELAWTDGTLWTAKTNYVSAFAGGYPYTIQDMADDYAFLRGWGAEELIRQAYEKHGIYLIAIVTEGGENCLLTTFPMEEVSDLKGHKIRASGINADLMSRAGLAATYFPAGEIYGALETGVVEGVIFANLALEYEMGFHEVTKYIVVPKISPLHAEFDINLEVWNELPDDLREILHACAVDQTSWISAHVVYNEAKYEADMIENWGFQISHMNDELTALLRTISMELLEEHSGDPDFAKLADLLKDYLATRGLL